MLIMTKPELFHVDYLSFSKISFNRISQFACQLLTRLPIDVHVQTSHCSKPHVGIRLVCFGFLRQLSSRQARFCKPESVWVLGSPLWPFWQKRLFGDGSNHNLVCFVSAAFHTFLTDSPPIRALKLLLLACSLITPLSKRAFRINSGDSRTPSAAASRIRQAAPEYAGCWVRTRPRVFLGSFVFLILLWFRLSCPTVKTWPKPWNVINVI